MRKIILFLALFVKVVCGMAQLKVTFTVQQTAFTQKSPIYVAGTFNQWDTTAKPAYQLRDLGAGKYSITLDLPAGEIQYKYHRGNWNSVEKTPNGYEVANRKVILRHDTTLLDEIAAWRDNFLEDKWLEMATENSDSVKLRVINALANAYAFNVDLFNADSALAYTGKAMQLFRHLKHHSDGPDAMAESSALTLFSLQEVTAYVLHALGNYTKALENRLENIRLAASIPNKLYLAKAYRSAASDYTAMGDLQKALQFGLMSDSVLRGADRRADEYPLALFYTKQLISNSYHGMGAYKEALDYARQAADIDTRNLIDYVLPTRAYLLANAYSSMQMPDSAMMAYRYVLHHTSEYMVYLASMSRIGIAQISLSRGKADSALILVKQAYGALRDSAATLQSIGEDPLIVLSRVTPLLADLYMRNGQPDSAYRYLQLSVALKDSIFNADKVRQFQLITFNEAARQQELEQKAQMAEEAYRTRLKFYGLLGCLAAFLALAFVLFRSNRHKQKANALLASQKLQLENAIQDLKSTQAQLIQSEKMASIGELTAGIAHEIQNPLNFVNNFSDVSVDLIKELEEKLAQGNAEAVKSITADLAGNLEKINQHGERASGIVRAMLQHSRGSSGEKERVNINAMCDEYLRLAYHGYRAKEKTFNASFETSFDPDISPITAVPQDLGRVLLNIINNAFYAVHDKKLKTDDERYEPRVEVFTKAITASDKSFVEIGIRDNGMGILPELKHKVFQPFFTTKPTGQGTGLGLSLAYDIVIKGHGGSLSVDSTPGEGTCFLIRLPLH